MYYYILVPDDYEVLTHCLGDFTMLCMITPIGPSPPLRLLNLLSHVIFELHVVFPMCIQGTFLTLKSVYHSLAHLCILLRSYFINPASSFVDVLA